MKRIGMEQWLSAYNFNSNPFTHREAGSERLLNQYFVAPSYFDEILGATHLPQTALVFAPRGGGKTAQRVMVDYHCRERLFQGRELDTKFQGQVLSVLHTDFTPVVEEAQGDLSKISARSHVNEILRRTVVALCDYISSNPGAIRSIHEMSDRERLYIIWFIHKYKNYLTPRKIDALDETGIKLPSLEENRNAGLTEFLTDREHIPPSELLANFSDLIHTLGIDAVYVLVDRVDEFLLTASDPIGAVSLVEPLLADLTIMNLSRMAFKFFLPQQLEDIIKSRSSIRQDRLIFRRIEWTEFALQEVLHKRLEAFSNYSDMDAVCVPELRGRIEKEMIELADGSPRSLIRLGSLLLAEHCELPMPDNQDEWLISEKAWEEAQKKFAAEIVNQWGISDPEPDVVQSELLREKNDNLDSDDIRLLIKGGESSKLEFKSTMRWSSHTNKPEKEV